MARKNNKSQKSNASTAKPKSAVKKNSKSADRPKSNVGGNWYWRYVVHTDGTLNEELGWYTTRAGAKRASKGMKGARVSSDVNAVAKKVLKSLTHKMFNKVPNGGRGVNPTELEKAKARVPAVPEYADVDMKLDSLKVVETVKPKAKADKAKGKSKVKETF